MKYINGWRMLSQTEPIKIGDVFMYGQKHVPNILTPNDGVKAGSKTIAKGISHCVWMGWVGGGYNCWRHESLDSPFTGSRLPLNKVFSTPLRLP